MSTQEHDAAMAADTAPVVEDASAPTEPQGATFANAPTARAADGDPKQPDVPSSVVPFVSSTPEVSMHSFRLTPLHLLHSRSALPSSQALRTHRTVVVVTVCTRVIQPLLFWKTRGCHLVLFQVPPELAGEHQLAVKALELWRLYGAVIEKSVRKLVDANAFTTGGGNYESPKDVEAAVVWNGDPFVKALFAAVEPSFKPSSKLADHPLSKVVRLAAKRVLGVMTQHCFTFNKQVNDTVKKTEFYGKYSIVWDGAPPSEYPFKNKFKTKSLFLELKVRAATVQFFPPLSTRLPAIALPLFQPSHPSPPGPGS